MLGGRGERNGDGNEIERDAASEVPGRGGRSSTAVVSRWRRLGLEKWGRKKSGGEIRGVREIEDESGVCFSDDGENVFGAQCVWQCGG